MAHEKSEYCRRVSAVMPRSLVAARPVGRAASVALDWHIHIDMDGRGLLLKTEEYTLSTTRHRNPPCGWRIPKTCSISTWA